MPSDNIPEGLSAIQDQPEPKSALTLYEGKRETDLVDEEIDERILTLLGLKDVFDIDYGTYKTLLREKLAEGRITGKELPREEDELLVEEFRRIKSKVGRFRIKKKNIFADYVEDTKSPVIKSTKLLPQSLVPEKDLVETKSKDITDIQKLLDSILLTIRNQSKDDKKKIELDRRASEAKKRKAREASLEKGLDKVKSVLSKIIAPFQGIIDKIKRFLFFTILGRAFKVFMDWASDPNNKKKLEVVGRFLKDWWPALLGAWFLFADPLGKFVRSVIGSIAKLTIRLAKFAIPKLLSFAKANPIAAIAVTGAVAAGAGEMWRQKEEKNQVAKEAEKRKVDPTVVQKELDSAKSSPFAMFGQGMSNIGGYNNGGSIFSGIVGKNDGTRVSGAGEDTQYFPVVGGGGAVLAPNELVLNENQQAQMHQDTGVHPASYVSGVQPEKLSGKITPMASGGVITKFNSGGMIPGGPFTPLPSPGYVRPQGSFIPKPILRLPGPIPGSTVPFGYNPMMGLEGGGLVSGLDSFARDTFGRVGENYGRHKGRETGIPGGSWVGEQLGRNKGQKVYDTITSPFRRFQGGGMIPGGPFTPLPSPGYVRPQGSFIPKPILRLPGPMPGTTVPFGYNPMMGLEGGGIIKPQESLVAVEYGAGFPKTPKWMLQLEKEYQKTKDKPFSPGTPKPGRGMGDVWEGPIQGAQGGGLIQALGRFLPGTGTVMAPRSGGPKDIRGVRQTQAGYQNKLLGMPIGNVFYPKGRTGEYSQQENRRYYERTGKYFVPTNFGSGYLPGIHGLYSPPRPQSVRTGTGNQKLDAAIQNARDVTNMPGAGGYKPLVESTASIATKKQRDYDELREAMRRAGMSGANESMNIYGKPIKREGGGSTPITTKTGIPTSKMGIEAGADTQYLPPMAVQPGEAHYIVPKDAVQRGAVPIIDYVVAKLDPNSNPKNKGKDLITPPPKSNIIPLPPEVIKSASSTLNRPAPGSQVVPTFSAYRETNERYESMKIYTLRSSTIGSRVM